jgi:hypothetical protein
MDRRCKRVLDMNWGFGATQYAAFEATDIITLHQGNHCRVRINMQHFIYIKYGTSEAGYHSVGPLPRSRPRSTASYSTYIHVRRLHHGGAYPRVLSPLPDIRSLRALRQISSAAREHRYCTYTYRADICRCHSTYQPFQVAGLGVRRRTQY